MILKSITEFSNNQDVAIDLSWGVDGCGVVKPREGLG
jgi:hypothetical protein